MGGSLLHSSGLCAVLTTPTHPSNDDSSIRCTKTISSTRECFSMKGPFQCFTPILRGFGEQFRGMSNNQISRSSRILLPAHLSRASRSGLWIARDGRFSAGEHSYQNRMTSYFRPPYPQSLRHNVQFALHIRRPQRRCDSPSASTIGVRSVQGFPHPQNHPIRRVNLLPRHVLSPSARH